MEENRQSRAARRRRKLFWKEVREWIVALVSALLVVLVVRTCVFTLIRVDGNSMAPTLLDGERLFVTIADVKFGDVHRNDVVICRYPNRGTTNFVKRVVGLPGDQIYREDGVTHIVYPVNGPRGIEIYDTALDVDFSAAHTGTSGDYKPYTLAENEYFVVGDNRYKSHDSRDWNDSSSANDVGPITRDMIVGHVRQVIWPLNSIRPVE